MAVFLASFEEERLHLVYDLLLFLTHGLTQGIALSTCEVGQLTREKHHLLLIDGDAIGVLEVFLHAGNVIGDRLLTILTGNERGDIVHRSRTVEGIHSDQVLKDRRLELTQIFLHTGRLKLESTDGAALLIELIGEVIVDRDVVEVDDIACCLLDDLAGFLELRERLESEEVHLDQSGGLDDVSVVLRDGTFQSREVRVVGRGHGDPVADRVPADDETTGVKTGATDGALELPGIFDGVALTGIGRRHCLAQLRRAFDGILQVHLHAVGQSVGDGFLQCVGLLQRQLLHTRHVGERVLRGHTAVGDDVGTVLVPVFVHDPTEHLAASVIVEVGINIREVDTIGIEETLKQQVVFQRVNLCDTQAIGDHRAGGGATARSHPHAELVAGGIDEVLHDEEVTRETHRLHHV